MNIMYAGNHRVFDGILISLLSVIKYNHEPVRVYLLTMDLREENDSFIPLTEEQSDYLDGVVKEVNPLSKVERIDITEVAKKEMCAMANMKSKYTPYAMLRLYADEVEILPKKILYLDTDTVCRKDIKELFDTDISEYEFAAVKDYYGKIFRHPNYVNSGVLLLNMEKIKQTNLFKKARHLCLTKKMLLFDQDALNKYVVHKLILPTKYNAQKKMKEDTVIRHFAKTIKWIPYFHTVNIKPWEVDKVRNVYKIHEFDDILDDYIKRINNQGL